ncbi:Lung surfactant protein D coiled-coil trimerization domain-containing protein [Dioscorea alata]|uniref:Lung surfactant protein D coiled-coil trimerization domain-containing protein n=1 Tax=Dioscorea alata TaxID=55571 RepID=A0ACB7W783_DIOAL|nr:Lung surfactant protein D coiled-coil trimerization domain-containing protein [Dioscorea alata]
MERQFFRRSNPWKIPSSYSYYHPRPQPQSQPQPTKPKIISVPVHFVNSDDTPIREPRPKPVRDPKAERLAAVMRIQRITRGFLVRKNLRAVKKIEAEVEEIRRRIEAAQDLVRRDEKERLRLNEMLMRLLFRLDSVRGVRDYRKRVIRKVIALQEAVDSMAGSMEMGNGEEGVTLGTPDRETMATDAIHEGSEGLEVGPMEETLEINDITEMKQGGEPEILGEGDVKEETTNDNSNFTEETSGIKDISEEPLKDMSSPELEEKTTEIGDVVEDRLVETIETLESAQQGGQGCEEIPVIKEITEMNQGGERESLGERDLKEGSTNTNSNPIENASGIKDLGGESMEEIRTPEVEEKATEVRDITEDPIDKTIETVKSAQKAEINNCCSDPIGETFEASGTMEEKTSSSGSEGEAMKEVMDRVAAESAKLRELVAKLCERSAQQCMMMGGLAQRVENLERTVQRMEAARKKKKMKHRC